MIERAMHALKKGADIASVVWFRKRQSRLIETSIGPLVVGGKSLQMRSHGSVSSPSLIGGIAEVRNGAPHATPMRSAVCLRSALVSTAQSLVLPHCRN